MLKGEKVTLRVMNADDIEELVPLFNNLGEQGDFGDVRLRTVTAMRKRFEEDGWWSEREGMLLITTQDRIIGDIVFFEGFRNEDGFEVGYGLFRQADRGKGYGTEALRLFSAYLFEAKPIARLHIKTGTDNVAARRIAEKCGFVLEGTFRNFDFYRGRRGDVVVLALLREDCPTLADVQTGAT